MASGKGPVYFATRRKRKRLPEGERTHSQVNILRRYRAYFYKRRRLRTCFRNNECPFRSSVAWRNMEKDSRSSPRHRSVEQACLDRDMLVVWYSNSWSLLNRNSLLSAVRHRRAVILIPISPFNRCQRRRNKKEATEAHDEKRAAGKVPAALGAEDQAERTAAAASGEERQVKAIDRSRCLLFFPRR